MERLDKHFKAITRAAFERHGFAQGEILIQWPAIAGDKLAQWATPVRITWPRQPQPGRKSGGLLLVRVDPARALDLQYEAPRLIERINSYFGYGAIAAIKVVQGPALPHKRPAPRRADRPSATVQHLLRAQLAGIVDQRLHDALAELGSGVHRPSQKTRRD